MLVDYAETRLSLASMLRAVADDSGGRLRVLLLARGAGEWWAQLEASSDASVRSLAAAAAQVLVGPELGPSATADDLVLSAVRAFSHELGITMPDRVAAETHRDRCRSWCCTPQPFWQCWMQRNTTKPPGRYRGVITPRLTPSNQ